MQRKAGSQATAALVDLFLFLLQLRQLTVCFGTERESISCQLTLGKGSSLRSRSFPKPTPIGTSNYPFFPFNPCIRPTEDGGC